MKLSTRTWKKWRALETTAAQTSVTSNYKQHYN